MSREEFQKWYAEEYKKKQLESKAVKEYEKRNPGRPLRRTSFRRGGGVLSSIGSIRSELGIFQGKGDAGMGARLSEQMVGTQGSRQSGEILLGQTGPGDGVDYGRIQRYEVARAMALEKRKQIRRAAKEIAMRRMYEHKKSPQDILIGMPRMFDGLGPEDMDTYRTLVYREPREKGRKQAKSSFGPGVRFVRQPTIGEVAGAALLGIGPSRKNGRKPISFV